MPDYSRIAIITGATSGIGEATARKFVASGFGVVGNGRNTTKLSELEGELGAAFCSVTGDAADQSVVSELFAASVNHFGKKATIVVANAGRGLCGSVMDADLSRFDEILTTNLAGVLAICQRAARELVPIQQEGYPNTAADIVMIGSVVGRHISPFSAVYGATKFAVHALAEGLRREIGPHGVRVSLVEPAIVVTGFQASAGYSDDMTKVFADRFGPLLVAEDIADTINVIVTQPPHLHISDVVVRPTRQDYP